MAGEGDRTRSPAGGAPEAPLEIAVSEREGVVVLALSGDIDLDGRDRLEAALADAVARAGSAVVADLRECTFLGSTGARLLLVANDAATARGVRLSLTLGRSPARRVIELLGVGDRIDILDASAPREPALHIDPQALSASVEGLAAVTAGPTSLEDDLGRVIEATRQLFAVSGTGLMMVDAGGALRYVLATDPAGAALEAAQEEIGEGPCVDAFVLSREIRVDDLAADGRYPRLAERVVPRGVHAVLGVPTRVGGTPVGSLNVYRDAAYSWDDSDAAAIGAYNAVVESLLVSAVAARKSGELAAQLQHALDRRVLIERAVGLLMGRHGVDAVTAFNALRRQARDGRRAVVDLAADVLEGADVASLSGRSRS
jgi:anti-anti-sigma factor